MEILIFEKIEHDSNTSIAWYKIFNKGKEFLGFIYYYKGLKQWMFQPNPDYIIFRWDSMQEIVEMTQNYKRHKVYKERDVYKLMVSSRYYK